MNKKEREAAILDRGRVKVREWLEKCEKHGQVYHVADWGRRDRMGFHVRFFTLYQTPFDELIVMAGMAKEPELAPFFPELDDVSDLGIEHSAALDVLSRRLHYSWKKRAFQSDSIFETFYHLAQFARMTDDPHAWAGKIRLVSV